MRKHPGIATHPTAAPTIPAVTIGLDLSDRTAHWCALDHPSVALSIGFRDSVSFLLTIQATEGFLTGTPRAVPAGGEIPGDSWFAGEAGTELAGVVHPSRA